MQRNKSNTDIGMIIAFIALGISIIGLVLPSTNGLLLKTVADTLYCSISASILCPSSCNNPTLAVTITAVDNCNSSNNGFAAGYCPNGGLQDNIFPETPCNNISFVTLHLFGSNSTQRTFSSSTYTTYTKTTIISPSTNAISSTNTWCVASANLDGSSTLVIINFRIKDLGIAGQSGIGWAVSPALASDNFTISYQISGLSLNTGSIPALQFSITGTGTMTIWRAGIECVIVDATQSGIVR